MSGAGGTSGFGYQTPNSSTNQFNVVSFIIERALAKVRTIVPVKVIAITNKDADATGPTPTAVGFVDVQPLVNQLDGLGNSKAHGTIFHLPYFRLQGGTNAIVLDPQVGDLGFAAICDRDITSVKNNKAIANPGSFRRFDLADGIYLGGILGPAPTQFLTFNALGVALVSAGVFKLTDAFGDIISTDKDSKALTISSGAVVNVTGGSGVNLTSGSGAKVQVTSNTAGIAPSSILGKFPTYQRLTGSGTYVPTDNTVAYIKGRMRAAGGGGASTTTNGNAGNDSSFDFWTAIHGNGGALGSGPGGGAGGTGGVNGTGFLIERHDGGSGTNGASAAGATGAGGPGGSNGAGAGGGQRNSVGLNAPPGSGGGGGGSSAPGASTAGGGGGAGEYVEFLMTAAQIGAGVPYVTGTKGTGGAGTPAGGDGGDGSTVVEEFYN